jgi:two-component system, LytTR family, response regulator
MKIKCLAIDDEPYALKQIADYISKTPFLELSNQCYNAFEAMEILSNSKIDLIFIDINMPEMTGMEFAKTLPVDTNIIFTTAYSEYAAESYKVDAIDYLLKPISYENFLKSANKAKQVLSQNNQQNQTEKIEHFFVKADGKLIKVEFSNIEFIESQSEYVKIHIINQKPIMTLMSLKNLENSLPKEQFMRVHRSYIVNLKKITTIERNHIIFNGKTIIPVSEQYKNEFKYYLNNYFLFKM